MADNEKAAKKPFKGGRKGGTTFPRISLKEALEYSDKLVRKTHTGPQPEKTILTGVFGNSGPKGKVRASALKQFGLLEGDATAYQATMLAKNIESSPEDERAPLLQSAFLAAKPFKELFETFHGDPISKSKIKQAASGLKVHPESSDQCAELFMESSVTAGLGSRDGDILQLLSSQNAASGAPQPIDDAENAPNNSGEAHTEEPPPAEEPAAAKNWGGVDLHVPDTGTTKAGVTVNLNVDSSSDPDKLEKQLKLLKQFGVI